MICLFLAHSAAAEKAPNEIFAETYWNKIINKDIKWFQQRLAPRTRFFSYQIGQDVGGKRKLNDALLKEMQWWGDKGFEDAEIIHVKTTYTRERIALESIIRSTQQEIPVILVVDNTGAQIDFIRSYYCYECLEKEKETLYNPIFVSNNDLVDILPPAAAEFIYRLTDQIKLSTIFTKDAFIINEKGDALEIDLLDKVQNEMGEDNWHDHSLTRLTFDGATCVLEANINFRDSIQNYKLPAVIALDMSSSMDSIARWAMYYPRNLMDARVLQNEQIQASLIEEALAEKEKKNNRVKLGLLALSVSIVLYQLVKFITSNPA